MKHEESLAVYNLTLAMIEVAKPDNGLSQATRERLVGATRQRILEMVRRNKLAAELHEAYNEAAGDGLDPSACFAAAMDAVFGDENE